VYWELYYHFIWRTKGSEPLLTPRVEPPTHQYLVHRAMQTPEVIVHAVGGVEDHVHLAVSLPPSVEIAKWVGDLKGATSHHINHGSCGISLVWQTGYGVVSFGKRDLPWVVAHIRRRRELHAAGRSEDRLERITQVEDDPPQGAGAGEAR
jgi:putative transposase